MSRISDLATEQENLSGAFDMEEYIHWAEQYDEETLTERENERVQKAATSPR